MVITAAKPHSLETFLELPETKPASEFINDKISQKPMPQGKHSREPTRRDSSNTLTLHRFLLYNPLPIAKNADQ